MARISDLIYKDMVNKDLAYPGIYMAELMQDINGKIKVYVPSVMNRPTTVNELESLPEAVWCAYNLESCDITNAEKPMWVMFEAGDVKRPVIVSYTVVGDAGNNGISNSGSSNGSFGNMSIASGSGVINIMGPINDSRCTKYTNIEDVPQVFSFMNWSSISGHVHQAGDADMDEPLYLASTRNELTNKTISFNGVSDSGTSPVTVDMKMIGNCMMIATTKKFGKAGDYLYVHCTNGQEFACIKIDEKDETYAHGTPANSWGHWFNANCDVISIVELIVNSNGKNVNDIKVDYIVNCGSYMSNPDLASGDLISYAKSNITVTNGIASSVNTDNAIIDKAVNWAISKANDPNVTYSYGADGPNQYDCSHFVYRAFHDGAGINLSYAATGSMPSVYTNYGFKRVNISNFNDTSQLQVGDILVSASHTAIYIGNNQIVHASTANAPTADQVKVAQYSYNNSSSRAWTSCLRYIGG